jgi:hypothetical protein
VGGYALVQDSGIEARHGSVQYIKGKLRGPEVLKGSELSKGKSGDSRPSFSRLSSARGLSRGGNVSGTPALRFQSTIVMAESGVVRGVCTTALCSIYATLTKR